MVQNFYANYDPISANGILNAPIKELTFTDLPVTIPTANSYAMPQMNAGAVDKFISTAKNPNPTPTWKKVLFYGLLGGAVIMGMRKLKINPFRKITNSPKLQGIKNFVKNSYGFVKRNVLLVGSGIKNFAVNSFNIVKTKIGNLFNPKP